MDFLALFGDLFNISGRESNNSSDCDCQCFNGEVRNCDHSSPCYTYGECKVVIGGGDCPCKKSRTCRGIAKREHS